MATAEIQIVNLDVDVPNIGAGAALNVDVAVPDAILGHLVIAQPSVDLAAGAVLIGARVSADGNVRLRFYNPSAAGVDPAAQRWTFILIKES